MHIRRSAGIFVMAGALVLAGCSGTGQEEDTTDTDSGTDLTIAVVTHGPAGDAFWDVVKSGADRAGKDLGITVNYNGDGDPTAQSELIDNAVSQGVDGIVVSMANPDGVEDAVKAAVAAGIPVITINAGLAESAEFGALTHIGQDESVAGAAVGQRLNDDGVTGKVLCVIQAAGVISLEQRCAAVAENYEGGDVENIQVDGTNDAAVTDTLLSKLQSDAEVTGVVTLGGQTALSAVAARDQAQSDAVVDTFDVNSDVIKAVQAGDIGFAIDQQPFVQGYLGVQFLYLYNINGNIVGGGQPVLSGPAFVDADNADTVAEFAGNGTR